MISPSLLPHWADSTSLPRARHARTRCKRAGWRLGPAQNGSDRAIPPLAPRSCPIGPCRRKYDLSRAGLGSVPGRPVAVAVIQPGFQAFPVSPVGSPPLFPPRFLSARFPAVAMPPVAGIADVKHHPQSGSGKSTAATPLLWPSHPSRAWTTALSWNSGCAVAVPSKRGRHEENPIVSAIGVSLSNFGPDLPEPAGVRVHDGSQVDCRLLPRLARRRGELEGIESRVDWGRDRRSVVHPPVTALEQLRARVSRFVPLRGACVIHGIPRRGRRRCLLTTAAVGPDASRTAHTCARGAFPRVIGVDDRCRSPSTWIRVSTRRPSELGFDVSKYVQRAPKPNLTS